MTTQKLMPKVMQAVSCHMQSSCCLSSLSGSCWFSYCKKLNRRSQEAFLLAALELVSCMTSLALDWTET